ncbi:MAG: hypothetical protein O6951_02910 [Actinobacteria bacterium]|nr:hypothetical protein [Actinomycetota bacterium]
MGRDDVRDDGCPISQIRTGNRISWLLAWIGIIGIAGAITDSALPDELVDQSLDQGR